MTNKQKLEKAKKDYSKGTKFISVTSKTNHTSKEYFEITPLGFVFESGACIYSVTQNKWAEIVK